MNPRTRRILIPGPAGQIELALDEPDSGPRGFAVVAHPHPQFGGTLDNKVTQTLARTLLLLGYTTARPNFRGVGASEGSFDAGQGETEDVLCVIDWLRETYPNLADKPMPLAGFSFGSFVMSRVAQRLATLGRPAERLILVGTATSRFSVETVPADTILIHGELDETVPLASVLDWARPQELPVIVVPGADHFFHRRLAIIKNLALGMWKHDHSDSSDVSAR